MNYNSNFAESSTLRMEIAVLQKDVDSQKPGTAEFTIPALVSNDTVGTVYTNYSNIINKNTIGTPSMGAITACNTIMLKIPKEYTMFYGSNTIPKGTRFIVAFIGANVNDIKIIGRYDNLDD